MTEFLQLLLSILSVFISVFCLLDWPVVAVTICDGVPSPTDVLAVT